MGHSYTNEHKSRVCYPIMHCLMNRKTQEAYTAMLHKAEALLKELLNDRELKFNASIITTDFEVALLNAIKDFWPKCQQLGCYVHFLRCLTRKLKELGFGKKEQRRSNYKLITLLSTLAWIDPKIVKNVFKKIRLLVQFKDYSDFFVYFENT